MRKHKTFNAALSKRVAELIKAEPKMCWRNAFFSIREVPKIKGAMYVEGFIVRKSMPIPFEHGWLEMGQAIIDPTRVLWANLGDEVQYYPGFKCSRDELEEKITKKNRLPIVYRFRNAGLSHPPYAQAFRNAHQAAGTPISGAGKLTGKYKSTGNTPHTIRLSE
jgi:hypothetical protein